MRIPDRSAQLVIFTLGLVAVLAFPAHHDVAWFLYMARRVLAGDTLYSDIVDVNPPLIVLMGLPAELLARVGLWDVLAFRMLTLMTCAISVVLIERILAVMDGRAVQRRTAVLLVIIAFLLLEPVQFGQREHIAFVLVAPWVIAVGARTAGRDLPAGAAVLTGVLAGLGFAMKPHFLIVPAALEAFWFMARSRATALPPAGAPRPEVYALISVLATYGIGITMITPAYFEVAGLARRAYAGFAEVPIRELLFANARRLFVVGACVSVCALSRGTDDASRTRQALIVASLGFLFAAVSQRKGWTYQWVPATGFATIAAGTPVIPALAGRMHAFASRIEGPGLARRLRLESDAMAALMAVFLAVPLTVVQSRAADNERVRLASDLHQLGGLLPLIERHAADGPIAALSVTMLPGFPLVNYAETEWGLRFNSLWPIASFYAGPPNGAPVSAFRTTAEMGPDERYLFEAATTDLVRRPPKVLIVDTTPFGGANSFDWLAYFSQDRGVRALLADYRPLAKVAQYVVLQRDPTIAWGTP